MIVTIDGPAGAGKSTVARALASRLGFDFLDTGALYRMATLAAVRAGADATDDQAVESLLMATSLDLRDGRAILDGDDVSSEIREPETTRKIQAYADSPIVRRIVTARTRELAEGRDVVAEGRDQGSFVFPEAQVKFFLTASDEVRARRRLEELAARGLNASFDQVLADQRRRDREDASRAIGALIRPAGAIEVDSTGLALEEVVEAMVGCVRAACRGGTPDSDVTT
jgi:cytidylate kinase